MINSLKKLISLTFALLTAGIPALIANDHQQTVYIASGSSGLFRTTLNDRSGNLTEAKRVADIQGSGFLTIHPNQKYLYATAYVTDKDGGVAAYAIEKNGTLTELNRESAKGKRLCHVSLDHSSQMLMAANYGDGYVVSFLVKDDGSVGKQVSLQQHLGASVHPKRQTRPHAHSIYHGPDNRFAYAPDLGIDKVMIYQIHPKTAKLTPAGATPLPAGAGPRHMKFGKNGQQAYVLNELLCSVSIFDRNPATGVLTPKQVIDTLPDISGDPELTCSEILISNDGKFAYCANRDLTQKKRDSISVFAVQNNGTLKWIQSVPAEIWIPRHINLSPSGKWLLVAGQKSDLINVLKVNLKTGQLSATGHQITVPQPMCIDFTH